MKKFNFNLFFSALIFVSVLTLASCSKDQDVLTPENSIEEPQLPVLSEANPEISKNITLQNGLLNFKSVQDFRNTLLALNRMNPNDLLQWEESLEFTSMRQIFNSIVIAEFETIGSHSELYNLQLQSELIVENETTGLYDLNLFNPAYGAVLNKNGLVIVDDNIHQFTGNALKIWNDGDINRLNYLLETSVSNDDIEVVPMNFNEVILRNTPLWTDQCESGDDFGKLRLSAFYKSGFLENGNPDVVFIEYFITALSMTKTPGGEWEYDPDAIVKLRGKSRINFTVTNGTAERTRVLIKEYQQILGFGGNFTFIPEEAGDYNFGAPWSFVNPAHLMQAIWIAQNKLGDGSSFNCAITF